MTLREMVLSFSPEDQDVFWSELSKAVGMRGWDKICRGNKKPSHAEAFIGHVVDLCISNGYDLEEKT